MNNCPLINKDQCHVLAELKKRVDAINNNLVVAVSKLGKN